MLVLDYDNSLTDAEIEGLPFVEGYLKDLQVLLGLPANEFTRSVVKAQEYVATHLETDGWCVDGDVVAPPDVDPYIRMKVIGRQLLETAIHGSRLREAIQQVLYGHNYRLTTDSFRPGAVDLLLDLPKRPHNTFIVTNSSTDNVVGKINRGLLMGVPLNVDGAREVEEAMTWWRDHVVGNARKFDPSSVQFILYSSVQKKMRLRGFPRETVILRPHYLRVLESLLYDEESPREWKKVVVVGDIFELDLALPLVLGCHIGFMANEHTPPWEVEFVRSHPDRCRMLTRVDEILQYYDEVQAKFRS